MYEALNTLYVTKQPSTLRLDHETIRVETKTEGALFQMPLLHLSGIVCFGGVYVSPALIRRCAADGRSIALLDWSGHFIARIEGAVSGNVLLRQAQYRALEDQQKTLSIARNFLAGKLGKYAAGSLTCSEGN